MKLPVRLAHALCERVRPQPWMIQDLWAEEAVGIVGGEPKCCKSFLVLDMAVAVAAGVPCLRRFPVLRPGRVLLFAAEDSLAVVHQRVAGICAAAAVDLAHLDLHVITAPQVRLDLDSDRNHLADTVADLNPVFLILDPFVRLHRIDENVSAEVAPLLAFLRILQRRHCMAISLVHHTRKGAGRMRAGQALRGSSEFHAWGDSNLYLRRASDDRLILSTEHRAAAPIADVHLELRTQDPVLALGVADAPVAAEAPTSTALRGPSLPERICQHLRIAGKPLTHRSLREGCKVRTDTFCRALADLLGQGVVIKTNDGYALAPT